MTNIKIVKNDTIDSIEISGHANYALKGKDIVCASISCIVTTTVNALLRLDKNSIKYQVKDGFIKIDVLKHSKTIDILIDNMISELQELACQYKKNINI